MYSIAFTGEVLSSHRALHKYNPGCDYVLAYDETSILNVYWGMPLKMVQLGYMITCIVLANLKTKAAASIDCEVSSSVSSTPVEALASLPPDLVSRTASN